MIRSRALPAALVVAFLSPSAALAGTSPPGGGAPPVKVRLVQQTAGGSAPWLAASVAAAQRATLSTRLSATVQKVLVEEGARVTRGQLLVALSDDDVRAQLGAAQTALANATAYERRISELVAQRAATPVELEAAQAQRAQAAAAVAGARAALGYTQLRAPFDATVQARRVQAGDLVGPGQPLLELEGAGLEIQANLSDEEAKGLRLGQRLRFDAAGRQGEAEVTALTPGGDALAYRRFLRARVLGRAGALRSGSFARIEVPGAAARSTSFIPRTAVVERGDLTGVFVVEDGRARLRWISLGEPSGGQVAVRAGLGAGDAVIDTPGALRDEQPVEVSRGE